MEDLNLKRYKFYAIITIIVLLINIFVIGGIYFSINYSQRDLNEINNSISKIEKLEFQVNFENNSNFELNKLKLEYDLELNKIENEISEILDSNNDSNNEIEKLRIKLNNLKEENLNLENQIIDLEGQLK